MLRQATRRTNLALRQPQRAFLAVATRPFSALTDPNDASTAVVRPRNEGRSGVSGLVATVFGASGFLGRYVVNRLGRVGSQCIIPYRGDGMNVRHLKLMGDLGQIVPLPTDLADVDAVNRSVDRSNAVVNLVGQQFQTPNYNFHDANVKCTYRIAKAAKEAGVERFIHVSALGADRQSPSAFLKSKAESEEVVKEFFPDATILRPATIFGEEDQYVNGLANFAHFGPFVPTVDGGRNRVQPVFVNDVAAAVVNALGDINSVGRVYELGGGETYTQEEVINMIFEGIYLEPRTLDVPPAALKLYGRLVEKAPARFRLMSPDMVDRMLLDQVVQAGSGVGELKDLGIDKPVVLRERLAKILIRHGGQRSPARFTSYE
jgi:NADH dehydrogenase (ubiquinone) 1 alpha subcomplex subunit 9